MYNKYKKILEFYEDFQLHKGELSCKEGFFDFAMPDSIHSWHTLFGYGIREKRSCGATFNQSVFSEVALKAKDLKRRYYVKLTAMLYVWRKYVCGIELYINKKLVYKNENEFFENVNLGWPTLYIPIDNSYLKAGKNEIEIRQTQKDNSLLVADISLLSLPGETTGQQLTCHRIARDGEEIALAFYTNSEKLEIVKEKDCKVSKILKSPINPHHTILRISELSNTSSLKLKTGRKTFSAVLPRVINNAEDSFVLGLDSDDHRHDDSDETSRIIEIFANTVMGNFWQARPKLDRNYHSLSTPADWTKRIDFLKCFGMQFGLSDDENVMPYFKEICGTSYFGDHCHEPYLYFLHNRDDADDNDTFGGIKAKFMEFLAGKITGSDKSSLASVGSPTPLLNYEVNAGYDRVTIEPVANINLLISSVTGSCVKKWGGHIPIDWYFGEPNDKTKSRKFLASMQLLYINGADYFYPENAIFKTNAFKRLDWDDEFCTTNRRYMREFFDYTKLNPRQGEIQTELAVIYGNNDFFMWDPDFLPADGISMSDPSYRNWTARMWGKWTNLDSQRCWKAIDAWLVPADDQNSRKNYINQELFTGTPYGRIDIIPYEKDYSKYKSIAFLGWNTYEDGLAEKLYKYVKNGGTAYISYCHFNKTDRIDNPFHYADNELKLLLGKVPEKILSSDNDLRIADLNGISAEVFASDKSGNAVVIKKNIGKGTLYFGAFADYTPTAKRLAISKSVLSAIGENTATLKCLNTNISFVRRTAPDGKCIIDLLNVNTNSSISEPFVLKFKNGKSIKGRLKPCHIKKIEI